MTSKPTDDDIRDAIAVVLLEAGMPGDRNTHLSSADRVLAIVDHARGTGTSRFDGILDPDTAGLVDGFSQAVAGKLAEARAKYGRENDWLVDDWEDECRSKLLRHVYKGDPRDVAAFSAFCWARGWSTTPPVDREAPHRPEDG